MITVTLIDFYDVDYIHITETRVFDHSIPLIKNILHNIGDPKIIDFEITGGYYNYKYIRPVYNNPNLKEWFEILNDYPRKNGDSCLKGNLKLELLCQQGGKK